MNLPVDYDKLKPKEKRAVREEYVRIQNNKCYWCKGDLDKEAPSHIKKQWLDLSLFPPGFLNAPIHLQHNHYTGMSEGAVHAYCNGVMWQYDKR